MIYLATVWFETIQYNNNQAAIIANLVEKTWLRKYPRPTIIMYDQLNEFLCYPFKNGLIKNEYEIKDKFVNTANPQVNSILEIIHQVIANLVNMFNFQNNYLDVDGV